jgi:spore coat polysaccharide biosynthesis protein SpsF (cytidylyltransferase family)
MTAFVLCSRLSSSRVPAKPLIKYNGITQIEHLIKRMAVTNLPIFLAVPEDEVIQYSFLLGKYKTLKIYTGYTDDPLARIYNCAKENKIDTVIRVTHDKIFLDLEHLYSMLSEMQNNRLDYVYSSSFMAGTGYELISYNALDIASNKFTRVEHISYAIRAVSRGTLNYFFERPKNDIRLLIDFYEDVQLMTVVFATLGADCTLKDVIRFLDSNQSLKLMNRLPLVTVYTCAKNAEKWIQEAMSSVALQTDFKNYEYLLIDDYSTDKTLLHMAKFCQNNKNAKFIRNSFNIGLASSSNVALKNARGKYLIRLDADDFFIGKNAISGMIEKIEKDDADAVYPNCYAGLSQRTVQQGNENHHVGCTLFRASAINHIKFTDNLMNYDSLDFFLRAKDLLKISYYNKTVFCYRQHNESMSKNNLEERKRIKKMLESKYV